MNWLQKIAFEILSYDDFSYGDQDDEYYYHVTSEDRVNNILGNGIVPNRTPTVRGGFYEGYSAGKIFFCERSKVKWWADRIEEHLFHAYDDPPGIAIVRFPKEYILDKQIDEVGSEDSRGPSWYTERPIEEPE